MNTPNPLVPQGSLLEQQKSKSKSNLFIAVFIILAIHIVLFGGLLAQGCRREKPTVQIPPDTAAIQPETNLVAPPVLPTPATNPAIVETPSNVPPPIASTDAPITTPMMPTDTIPAPLPGPTQKYAVVKGDSFAKIAQKHGITVSSLSKANPNVDSRKLKIGQSLQIPAKTETPAVGAKKAADEPASSAAMTTYVVKPGDTLIRIAKTHATTVSAIRKANHFKTDRLNVGQKLKIPAPKSPTTAEPAATTTATAPVDQPAGGAVPSRM